MKINLSELRILLEYVFLFVPDDYIFFVRVLIRILILNRLAKSYLCELPVLYLYYLAFVRFFSNPNLEEKKNRIISSSISFRFTRVVILNNRVSVLPSS